MLPDGNAKIRFITEPEVHTIEGKNMLFFPFTKYIQNQEKRELTALSTD